MHRGGGTCDLNWVNQRMFLNTDHNAEKQDYTIPLLGCRRCKDEVELEEVETILSYLSRQPAWGTNPERQNRVVGGGRGRGYRTGERDGGGREEEEVSTFGLWTKAGLTKVLIYFLEPLQLGFFQMKLKEL